MLLIIYHLFTTYILNKPTCLRVCLYVCLLFLSSHHTCISCCFHFFTTNTFLVILHHCFLLFSRCIYFTCHLHCDVHDVVIFTDMTTQLPAPDVHPSVLQIVPLHNQAESHPVYRYKRGMVGRLVPR